MDIDNNLINEYYDKYQKKYLKNRNDHKALSNMCRIISHIAKAYTNKYIQKKGVYLSKERIEDISQDTVIRVLERYNRNSTWQCTRATAFFYFDWLKVITQNENNRTKQQRFEDSMESYPDYEKVSM